MKKTYIAPKTTVVELETESLMVITSFDVNAAVETTSQYESESRSTLWGED